MQVKSGLVSKTLKVVKTKMLRSRLNSSTSLTEGQQLPLIASTLKTAFFCFQDVNVPHAVNDTVEKHISLMFLFWALKFQFLVKKQTYKTPAKQIGLFTSEPNVPRLQQKS